MNNLLNSKALFNVKKCHKKMYILGTTFLNVCTLHIPLYKYSTGFLGVFSCSYIYTFVYISFVICRCKILIPFENIEPGVKKIV